MMSGADRLEGIRDVFGAYKMLSALDLNSKADLGFVLKHLAKVCDVMSEEPGSSHAVIEESKDLARIRTVYKAYKKLRKWVPEEAEKVLVEHLETILGLTDASNTQQHHSEPVQIKKEKTEEVTVKNEEIALDSKQTSTGVSAMATTPSQSLPEIIVQNEELASNLPHRVSMNAATPGQSSLSSSTVRTENNCDMDIVIRRRREFNITHDIKITIEKIPRRYLCLKKRRRKNKNDKETVTIYNKLARIPKRARPNFFTTNRIPVNRISKRKELGNQACICDEDRPNPSAVKNGVCYHRQPKFFVCKHCEKVFNQKSRLTSHKRVHTNEKPYTCKYCYKKFGWSSGLLVHLRIHTGEKPYKCKYCPNAFSQVSSLTLHERAHTGEKNYKCKHCQKAFVGHSTMKIHEKTHDTGRENKFECKLCRRKFPYKHGLKRHEKNFICTKGMPKLTKS